MNCVVLILTLLWGGWDTAIVGTCDNAEKFRGVAVGSARNDNITRVYAGADDGHIYEFTYGEGSWIRQHVAWQNGSIHSLDIGTGRNDGVNRLYAACTRFNELASPYEYTWNGMAWARQAMENHINGNHAIRLGFRSSDDIVRVYVGAQQTDVIPDGGQVYEFTWQGAWRNQPIGGTITTIRNYHHDIWMGQGRNDGQARLYSVCTNGDIWELSLIDDQWLLASLVDNVGGAWGVCVAEGRNDGVARLYVAAGEPQSSSNPGGVYEYTWESDEWIQVEVGKTSNHLLGLGVGRGRNDDTVRVYTGTQHGELYEYTWRGGQWQSYLVADIGDYRFFHDVVIAAGRGDDTLRVYAGCEDSRVYEFSYRPEPKIQVYPDSSILTIPGNEVTYNLWVVNEGTHPDVVDMHTEGTLPGWTAELTDWDANPLTDSDSDGKPDVGQLNVLDSVRIRAVIAPPESANSGEPDSTFVFGTSSLNLGVQDSALLETIISGIIIVPDQQDSVSAGQAKDYPLLVINLSESAHLANLWLDDLSAGWNGKLLDKDANELEDTNEDGKVDVGTIDRLDTIPIITRITAPQDAVGGMVDTALVHAQSAFAPAIRDAARLITTVKTEPLIKIVKDSSASTPAGIPVRYRALVTNLGNRDDAINLTRRGLSGWESTIYDATGQNPLQDTDGDNYPDAGVLPAKAGSAWIWLELTPDSTKIHDQEYTTYLIAFSSFDSGVRDSISLTTRVINPIPGVEVKPDTSATAIAGKDNVYLMRVINTGDEADIFLLTTDSDLGWDAWIADEDGNTLASTGDMGSGEVLPVQLHVTPPRDIASISGTSHEQVSEHRILRAVSANDNTVADSAWIVLLAVPPLDIHNFPNPFSGSTTFIYSIPGYGQATLEVYNRAGEHIITLFEDQPHRPGIHTWPWDGGNLTGESVAPGVYLYTLIFIPDEGKVQKVVKKALIQP